MQTLVESSVSCSSKQEFKVLEIPAGGMKLQYEQASETMGLERFSDSIRIPHANKPSQLEPLHAVA